MTQLALDLPYRTAFGRADFLVSASNEAALGWIERWPEWPSAALVLYGPTHCGKTHLARLWCARAGGRMVAGGELAGLDPAALAASGAIAIDDAHRAAERALLHLYNCCGEAGASLLIVMPTAPAYWPIALPDLASRLRALPSVAVNPPDDALLAAVLIKHFADRQLPVSPAVVDFLVRRIERSFATAAAVVGQLDRLALSLGCPVGLALARRVLAETDDGATAVRGTAERPC